MSAYKEYNNLNSTMLYFYGMRYRGYSPMCQPMNGLYVVLSQDEEYYNTLAYTRKLSEAEERDYELVYLGMK